MSGGGAAVLDRLGVEYVIDLETGCWRWLGRIDAAGFPWAGKLRGVRAFWEAEHGEIPTGWDVERTCGVRSCVSPHHGRVVPSARRLREMMQARSKLAWDDVVEMRSAWKAGVNKTALGRVYGIHNTQVEAIVQNEQWVDPGYDPRLRRRVCAHRGCRRWWTGSNNVKRYCCHAHCSQHKVHLKVLERRRRNRQIDTRNRLALASAASIHSPLGHGPGAGTVADIAADPNGVDPHVHLERAILREILADVDEESLDALAPVQLDALRTQLVDAGFGPVVV